MNPSAKSEQPVTGHTFSVSHHYAAEGNPQFIKTVGAGQLSPQDAHAFIDDRMSGPPYKFALDAGEDAPDEAKGRHSAPPAAPARPAATSGKTNKPRG